MNKTDFLILLDETDVEASHGELKFGLTLEDRWRAAWAAAIATLLAVEVIWPQLDVWLYWAMR